MAIPLDISQLLDSNLARVENLISLYGQPTAGRKKVHDTDILRAALVLLHASMEDYLRSLRVWKAPAGDAEHLNAYPLAGSGNRNSSKFLLGALSEHRGKTVDMLIEESVREYLEQYSSFNDLGEVKTALVEIGIAKNLVDAYASGYLKDMIARRHQIVHKADRNLVQGGQGNHKIASINLTQISNYLESVRTLRAFVDQHL